MNSSIFNDKVTENNYQEFVEQVINVFRLSSFNRNILCSLRLDKNESFMKIKILNQEGEKQEYDEVVIDHNETYFYDFLKYFVEQIRIYCEIASEDIVNLDDDNFVAFRMITKYNDLITIDGLTEKQANSLLFHKEEEKPNIELSVTNNSGGSSLLGFLVMIITLIISIILVVCIVD